MNFTKIAGMVAGFLIGILVLVSANFLPSLDHWTAGMIIIGMGTISLLGQFLVSKDRPASPSKWSGRDQKAAMIIGGVCTTIIGLLMLLIHR